MGENSKKIGYIRIPDAFVLLEEVSHVGQFFNGEIGFGYKEETKQWTTIGLDLMDEVNAKKQRSKIIRNEVSI